MIMWIEISKDEFGEILDKKRHLLTYDDVSDWVDFVEEDYRLPTGKAILRRTEQENYDEEMDYPSIVKYWKFV